VSAGRINVAGSTANAAMNTASSTAAHSGGQDVFVATFDAALTAGSSVVSYWGGAGADQVSAVAIKGTQVYVAGSSNADIGSLKKIGERDGFVARLDALTGAQEWARRYTGGEGQVAPSAISVGAGQASVLDRLGLPSGTIDYTGSQLITAATSARAGDRFYVKSSGQGRAIPIVIEAQDTMKTLAAKITRALGFNGMASVSSEFRPADPDNPAAGTASFDRIRITPRSDRSVEIQAGEGSRDLLRVLGLDEGLLRTVRRDGKGAEIVPRTGKTYGLNLARDLTVGSKDAVLRTAKDLDDAMVTIQNIYRDLVQPAAAGPKPGITGGQPSRYQLNQLANYQAGLARLTGGA
jgi:hypothetical protein